MNAETIVTMITNLVGVAGVIFGFSKETTATINQAIPSIVGGIMALASTIAYIYHKRQTRTAVFNKMVDQIGKEPANTASTLVHTNAIEAAARSVGMI